MNGVKTQMYSDGVPGGSWPECEKGGIISLGGQAAWIPNGVKTPQGKFTINLKLRQLPFIVQGGQPPTKPDEGFLVMGRQGLQLPEGAKGKIFLNPGKCEYLVHPVPVESHQEEDLSILPEMHDLAPRNCQLGLKLGPGNSNQESLPTVAGLRYCGALMNEQLPDGPGNPDKKPHGPAIWKDDSNLFQKLNGTRKPIPQFAGRAAASEGVGNTPEKPYILE